jgi:hypothetical protein
MADQELLQALSERLDVPLSQSGSWGVAPWVAQEAAQCYVGGVTLANLTPPHPLLRTVGFVTGCAIGAYFPLGSGGTVP